MLNQPKVLIVEDEPILAMLLEEQLRLDGYLIVGPCSNVSSALDVDEDIDIALLDVNLGGYFVDPVARQLAERDVPFLFVTAYGRDVITTEFSDRVVLQKPVDVQDLSDTLKRVLKTYAYKNAERARQDAKLAEALALTCPASDPPAVDRGTPS